MPDHWNDVKARLEQANTPAIVVALFAQHYRNLCTGAESFVRESDIRPADSIDDADELDASLNQLGTESLSKAAILKLNGGLGTSMGLDGPKSLLPVRGDDTFLAFILRQAKHLKVPLVLMNSFSTSDQTAEAIATLGTEGVDVINFQQHQVPKIDAETLAPISWPDDPSLQWCPPGHGDIYAALVTSGTLDKLLSAGRRYVFVSNADNLGATLDTRILGHFVKSKSPFLMEVADRTQADRKGGHLCKSPTGQLRLREKAQCHPDEIDSFQDIETHRYFNTNNLWIDLKALDDFMDVSGGSIELPTIVNRKTVDPKLPSSPNVFQLETAMGAAIEVLPNSNAIRVPRSRFAPVKTTGDLLAVRSDAYHVLPDHSVALIDERKGSPPIVALDDRYFKTIGDLDRRIKRWPSLRDCISFSIQGDAHLNEAIVARGSVQLVGNETPSSVPAGEYTGETRL